MLHGVRALPAQIEVQLPPHLNAELSELDKHEGVNGNETAVDLLLICCLAIALSRKGAINLIECFEVNSKPLRQEDTSQTIQEPAREPDGPRAVPNPGPTQRAAHGSTKEAEGNGLSAGKNSR